MNLNKRIIQAMAVILSLFLVLVFYLNYFLAFESKEYTRSIYNQRLYKAVRGSIYDRTGEVVLAKTTGEGRSQERVYPYGALYADTVGHFSKTYGGKALEKRWDEVLTEIPSVMTMLNDKDKGMENKGQDLYLTLDHGLTQHVDKVVKAQLQGKKNANIVVMNPKSGAVYCAYSSSSYDPNPAAMKEFISGGGVIDYQFDAVNEQFCPGSTFKVVTAAAAIDNGLEDFEINDETGVINVGGQPFGNDRGSDGNPKAMGVTDMHKAIVKSSNVYFTGISKEIGRKKMIEAFDKFYITKQIPFEKLNTIESGIVITGRNNNFVITDDLYSADTAKMASASFGQEPVKLSPLHMALVVSAIANNGKMMQPYLVEYSKRANTVENKAEKKVLSKACSENAARIIRSAMIDCVEQGTGTKAKVSGIKFGGKTGTAQVNGQTAHGWFIGFAPASNPQIAFCVMVENGGYGGTVCSPIVREIVSYCNKNGFFAQ